MIESAELPQNEVKFSLYTIIFQPLLTSMASFMEHLHCSSHFKMEFFWREVRTYPYMNELLELDNSVIF